MAIYHLSVKPISRSGGRSSTAAAAYRAAERVVDERTGEIFDFTRKAGVEHAEIVMPAGADWTPTREELWNAAEAAERRKDGCTAREHEVALPRELTAAQRLALVRAYAHDLADRHGCAADFAIHQPRSDATPGAENWHAHILMTTRQVDEQGLGQKCDREKAGRDRKADLQAERARWEMFVNAALAEAGHAARVDHRSLVDQRADAEHQGKHDEARKLARTPTRHRGPVEDGMQRRGPRNRRAAEREQQTRKARQAGADARHESVITRQEAERVARELRALKRKQKITHPPNRVEGERRRAPMVDFLIREERQGRVLYRWPNGSAAVVDRGDSLSIPATTDARLQAAAELAKAKGWKSVNLTGEDDFKRRAAAEMFRQGIRVTNPELQDYMQQLAAERQQADEAAHSAALPADAWELGRLARRIDEQVRQQETARARAARPELDEKLKRVNQAIRTAREKMMLDYPESELREIFATSICAELHNRAGELEAEAANDEQQVSNLQAGGFARRLLNLPATSQLKNKAEKRRADATRLRDQAGKLEEAARRMKHPKIVERYQKWLADREAAQAERLRKADEDREALQREKDEAREKAGYSPEKLQQAKRDREQVEQKAGTLPPEGRAEFDAARAGADRHRWEEDQREQAARERQTAALKPKSNSKPKGMNP